MGGIRYILILICLLWANTGWSQSNWELKDVKRIEHALNSESEESFPILSPEGRLYFVRTLSEENVGGKFAGQDIWYAEKNQSTWTQPTNDIKPLNNQFNNAVVGVADSGRTLYLNGTYSTKPEYQTGLSYTQLKNGKWSRPKPVRIAGFNPYSHFHTYFVNGDIGVMLLSFSKASDPDNEDLYVSFRKKEERWSKPEPLGAEINTSGAEFSPFIADDGKTIFFSSTGHVGLGDADVFRAIRLDDSWLNWSDPENMGEPINSSGFDAFYTQVAGEAYFASNRGGTFADIYRAEFVRSESTVDPMLMANEEMAKSKGFALKGFLDMKNPDRVGMIRVLDMNGNVVQRAKPNKDGSFVLQGVDKYSKYKLEIEGEEKAIAGVEIFFVNEDGSRVYLNEGVVDGTYPFETLERDIKAVLMAEVSEDDSQLQITQFVFDEGSDIPVGSTFYLYDQNGKVQDKAVVNKNGEFDFTQLRPGVVYQINLDEALDNSSIIYLVKDGERTPINGNILRGALFQKLGNQLAMMKDEEDQPIYDYAKLAAMQASMREEAAMDVDLEEGATFGFEYGQLPPEGTKVTLVDEDGNIVEESFTSEDGLFQFKKLNPDKKYSIKLDETADVGTDLSLYLIDEDGLQVPIAQSVAKGDEFTGSVAGEVDQGEDEEVFTFDYSALPPVGSKVYLTDENDNVIDSAYTDADGNFKFKKLNPDEAYLMKMADAGDQSAGLGLFVVNTEGKELKVGTESEKGDLITSKDAVEAKSKPQFNKFTFDYKNLPKDGSVVYLTDPNGNIIDSSYVDKKGNFRFKKLDPSMNYMFAVSDEDFDMDNANLYSVDKGRKRKLTKLQHSFAMIGMQLMDVEDSQLDVSQFQLEYEGDIPEAAQAYLYDEETNEIVETVEIESDGSFSFHKLDPERKYNIKFDDEIDAGKAKYFAVEDPISKPVAVVEAPVVKEETQPTKPEEPAPLPTPASVEHVVYFGFNEFLLTPDQIQTLIQTVVKPLKGNEKIRLELHGHTDSIGSEKVNLRMGHLRLSNVVYHLEMYGINETRMELISQGESRPVADNSTPEGRAKNRRVEISLVK